MKTCLIGVEGLLGRHWLDLLTSLDHEVVGIGPSKEIASDLLEHLSQYVCLDLTKSTSVDLDSFFKNSDFDNLIFNSGIDARPGTGQPLITQYDLASWKDIFEVNVFGLVKVLNSVLNQPKAPENIVVIGSMYSTKSPNSSNYSHYGESGLTKHPAYSASKFAELGIMKQYAAHYAKRGIKINMISPGAVFSNQDEKFIEKISEKIPASRVASPDEFKGILRYLIQDNSYGFGNNYVIDGGMHLW